MSLSLLPSTETQSINRPSTRGERHICKHSQIALMQSSTSSLILLSKAWWRIGKAADQGRHVELGRVLKSSQSSRFRVLPNYLPKLDNLGMYTFSHHRSPPGIHSNPWPTFTHFLVRMLPKSVKLVSAVTVAPLCAQVSKAARPCPRCFKYLNWPTGCQSGAQSMPGLEGRGGSRSHLYQNLEKIPGGYIE